MLNTHQYIVYEYCVYLIKFILLIQHSNHNSNSNSSKLVFIFICICCFYMLLITSSGHDIRKNKTLSDRMWNGQGNPIASVHGGDPDHFATTYNNSFTYSNSVVN